MVRSVRTVQGRGELERAEPSSLCVCVCMRCKSFYYLSNGNKRASDRSEIQMTQQWKWLADEGNGIMGGSLCQVKVWWFVGGGGVCNVMMYHMHTHTHSLANGWMVLWLTAA